jgi:hypothetical protein|tara:strand:+ start:811 stop:1440 length:630 start_codon:yes stop_codon:yes gene_type:complete
MDYHRFSEIKYLEFLPGLFLKRGSVHQIAGPSRFIFALMIARNIKSYITWIRGKEGVVSLYPDGIISWVDINKFILVDSMKSQESMWVIEEFLKSGVSELLVCELHKPIQYSSIRRIILSFKNVAEEKDSTLPIILLISSFQNKITGVESRWYMKPNVDIASPTKNKRFSLEERWELVCSKASLSVSSWIIKARQQGYNRRTIDVYKTI